MTWLTPAVGLVILLALGADVFITVLHPDGHGGPITRRLSGGWWRLWRSAAPGGERRDRWLALGGPFLAALTPAMWALLLIAGFALIYCPWMDRFLVSPGSLRAPWTEAIYYSGFVAATLGNGDIIPDLPALRLLTVIEAVSGFALFSAALSYILAVYRENGRKTTLASELALHYHARASTSASGPMTQREDWLEHVARELMHVIGDHAQYPILHYFRPSDSRDSLALQLAPLVRLASSQEGQADGTDGEGTSPGVSVVAAAVDRYLTAADTRFVRAKDDPSGDAATPEARYRRLLAYLGYRDLPSL